MMFGVEDYRPEGENIEGKEWIVPAEAYGVKVHVDRLLHPAGRRADVARSMPTNALRQMIHQTLWGPLDFLLLDLPPGTGDVHLSVISEMKVDGALIVTTPQRVALADVVRGVHMFRNEKVNIPILGLVENMHVHSRRAARQSLLYFRRRRSRPDRRTRKAAPTGQHTSDSQRVGSGGQRTARHLRKLAGRKILRPFGRKCRRRILRKQSLTITFSLYDDNSLRTRRFFLTSES